MELLHPNDLPVDAMKQSKRNPNIQVYLEIFIIWWTLLQISIHKTLGSLHNYFTNT